MRRNRFLRVGAGLVGIAVFATGLLCAPTARAAVVINTQTPVSEPPVFNFCTNNFDSITAVSLATETFASDGSVHLTIHINTHDVKVSDPLLGNCVGQSSLDVAISTTPGESTTETTLDTVPTDATERVSQRSSPSRFCSPSTQTEAS